MTRPVGAILMVALVCLFTEIATAERSKAPFLKSIPEAEELSARTGRPIVLDFYADF